MLHRIALERQGGFADVVIDFVPDTNVDWPELIELTTTNESTRVRLRLSVEELEPLAIAFDSAFTGGDGELFFRPPVAAG
jgi:hypothetical protein